VEIDGTTFLLEILNFLVLVWILHRFLYRPVLGVIERRRQGIADSLAEAARMQGEAEDLKARYEGRLEAWEAERDEARRALAREIEDERRRRREALDAELAAARERAEVAEARRRAEEARGTERRAMSQAARFSARLLATAACPELEARLVERLVEDLERLPPERVQALRGAWQAPPGEARVASRWPLDDAARERLEAALAQVLGAPVPVAYEQRESLLAGVRVVAGPWVLRANLEDDLAAFAELAGDGAERPEPAAAAPS
jgi:F-type H+-transporting ATPase subunit b